MSKGVNKAIILGYVGKDPEIRYTKNGVAIANFSVATTKVWKDKQTGEKQEKTEWHRVSCFSKLAEIVEKYVKKGSQVYIEGELQTRKWQGEDGTDRYSTEILMNELQMLGKNGDQESSVQQKSGYLTQESSSVANFVQEQIPNRIPIDYDNEDVPF